MATLVTNRKALAEYRILEDIEAGIALLGPEVKSVKTGHANLAGSYISVDPNLQAHIIGFHISPYPPAAANTPITPNRPRQLLLHKRQLTYLLGKQREKGLTIIPLSLYTKGGLIKVKLGLAEGKRQFDKRQTIKKRESDREIRRALRGKNR